MRLFLKRIASFLLTLSTPLIGFGIFVAFWAVSLCIVLFMQTWFLFVPLLLLAVPLFAAFVLFHKWNSKP